MLQKENAHIMMQKGDVESLTKLLQKKDFTPFMKDSRPEFSMDELGLKEPDEIRLLTLYIWANPYVEGGDLYFFNRKGMIEFWEILEQLCGKWGQDMSIVLKSYHVLSEHEYDGFSGMSLCGLLQPETVENVEVNIVEIDEEQLCLESDDYFCEEVD